LEKCCKIIIDKEFRFKFKPTNIQKESYYGRVSGKVALVTGASSGIGRMSALIMLGMGQK